MLITWSRKQRGWFLPERAIAFIYHFASTDCPKHGVWNKHMPSNNNTATPLPFVKGELLLSILYFVETLQVTFPIRGESSGKDTFVNMPRAKPFSNDIPLESVATLSETGRKTRQLCESRTFTKWLTRLLTLCFFLCGMLPARQDGLGPTNIPLTLLLNHFLSNWKRFYKMVKATDSTMSKFWQMYAYM